MAVTVKGFQGTLSDVDMATLDPHHTPTVFGGGDLLVTAVASARTVSVAAGSALSGFIKYTSDAAQTIALAPPASGGKWYAITLNRQWSPTSTCVLQSDDLGQTDSNGTSGGYPPPAVQQAAAALPNQPGTASSTTGQRQILALVYVRATDTTLVIHDMRMTATGAGVVQMLGFQAMTMNNLRHLKDGALVALGQFTMPGGGNHIRSLWERSGGTQAGYLIAVGDIEVNDGGVAGVTGAGLTPTTQSVSMADITNIAGTSLAPNLALVAKGTRVFEQNSQSRWMWNVSGDGRFRVWDWIDIPNGWQSGYNGASLDTNGGDSRACIAAGVVTLNVNIYRSASGLAINTQYGLVPSGLRPQNPAHGSCGLYPGSGPNGIGDLIVNTDGTMQLGTIVTATNAAAMRGSVSYRAYN